MRKLLAIVASLALLTSFASACSAGPGKDRACADKLMQQETQTTVVKGTFACLSPDVQNAARAYAINDDTTLARSLGPTGNGKAEQRFVEQSKDGGFVYEVSNNVDGKIVVDTYAVVYLDKNGKVVGVKATQ